MPALTVPLWLALAGALLQFVSLGTDFYLWEGTRQTAWFGVPHTSELIVQGLAALGAIGQFGFGYTFFTFYRTIRQDGTTTWSGWLPTPHTGSVVLAVTVLVVGLAWSVSRGRAPLAAAPVGAVIAVLGFVSTARIAYRIIQPPFGGNQLVQIGPAAYLALASAVLIVIAGFVQATVNRNRITTLGPRREP